MNCSISYFKEILEEQYYINYLNVSVENFLSVTKISLMRDFDAGKNILGNAKKPGTKKV